MSVVALRQEKPCAEVSATLRRIADEIETGVIEWPVTTAVLVLAHRDEKPAGESTFVEHEQWRTYGFGPRCDTFTCRGVLATVIHRSFDSGDGE